jgi:uncharacterized membrane protein YebE (DUF533 family)
MPWSPGPLRKWASTVANLHARLQRMEWLVPALVGIAGLGYKVYRDNKGDKAQESGSSPLITDPAEVRAEMANIEAERRQKSYLAIVVVIAIIAAIAVQIALAQ